MDKVDRLVEGWLQEGHLPGAVLDITLMNRIRFQKSYGSFSDGIMQHPIRLDTLFDIASLTKVTATLPAILLLVAQGKVSLDNSVSAYLPAFRHQQVSVRHLLLHASGLPSDLPMRSRKEKRPDIFEETLAQELIFQPGEDMRYSDLGMILLGIIVERVASVPLDRFVKQHIFDPLEMYSTVYNPGPEFQERIAATEPLDGTFIRGEVHDEKSFQLGGVSGSAGLFATADDLTRYAAWWMKPESKDIVPPLLLREAIGHPVRGRGLGWEVSHDPAFVPSCGISWPTGGFGHTGFTGTSIWVEPNQGISVIFLTNAVHLGRNNKIRELRPILHEAVLSSCLSGGLT
ncbi:serine hydrolase [Paenibacillus sp. N3.4]|uniref:serine hydrolase domain-containing protein n=1 Tax=Paenibacillus sp. N3.4 TaxID=2603222 RepID=UPI0011CADAAC|nr:serine hydrolase domain-containing protein [Paenibacillus sp. N3.4]TXK83737.1 beta-lactamase family protein [Paenibacillus sp. N3.4]